MERQEHNGEIEEHRKTENTVKRTKYESDRVPTLPEMIDELVALDRTLVNYLDIADRHRTQNQLETMLADVRASKETYRQLRRTFFDLYKFTNRYLGDKILLVSLNSDEDRNGTNAVTDKIVLIKAGGAIRILKPESSELLIAFIPDRPDNPASSQFTVNVREQYGGNKIYGRGKVFRDQIILPSASVLDRAEHGEAIDFIDPLHTPALLREAFSTLRRALINTYTGDGVKFDTIDNLVTQENLI